MPSLTKFRVLAAPMSAAATSRPVSSSAKMYDSSQISRSAAAMASINAGKYSAPLRSSTTEFPAVKRFIA